MEGALTVHNRQRRISFDLARLLSAAQQAAIVCLPHIGGGTPVLDQLESVEVSVISDRRIARVHRQFLRVSGPTDVITFEHGEILVSATTAARRAALENESTDRELARYVVHGLLHLNGHLDEEASEAAKMWCVQERVLQTIWPRNVALAADQRPGIDSKR